MAPGKEDSSNGYSKGNMSWQRLIMDIGRTFGIPSLLLMIIVYWLVWEVTPPLTASLAEFVTGTMATQAELAKTQQEIMHSQEQMTSLLEEVRQQTDSIARVHEQTAVFMSNVMKEHENQKADHTAILDGVGRIENNIKKKP